MERSKTIVVIVFMTAAVVCAQSVARITGIEGKAQILRTGATQWQDVRPNMPLKVGDQLYSHAESFVEIRYATGAIVRLDEKTKITVEISSEKITTTRTGVGQLWVNMKKMVASGAEFQVVSPTATAAIRGTVFQMNTFEDSTSEVSVFDGAVAVGPSDELKRQLQQQRTDMGAQGLEPVETTGPEEIPGPFEVSLEDWLTIVAGQRISVRSDGKFAREKFDLKTVSQDAFVKKNLELDRRL